jgi:hypothetical protein
MQVFDWDDSNLRKIRAHHDPTTRKRRRRGHLVG